MWNEAPETLPAVSIAQALNDLVRRVAVPHIHSNTVALFSARGLIITRQTAEPDNDPFRHLRSEEVQIQKRVVNRQVG